MTKTMSEVPLMSGLVELIPGVTSGLVEFVPGAIGGFCNVFIGHPMDLIKVRQQSAIRPIVANPAAMLSSQAGAAPSSCLGMLRNIMMTEGFNGLYRGITSPLLAVTPAYAISFWSFDLAKDAILEQSATDTWNGKKPQQLTIPQAALAGAFSGLPLATIVGPSERIKCLMQVDKGRFSGFTHCALSLYNQGGLRSIFHGTGITVIRDVPGNAIYFSTYELLKRTFCGWEGRRYENPSSNSIMLAGGLAGVANWVVAIPADSIKSRWQTAPPGRYTGVVDVFRTTVRHEGFQALFRGLTPALLRAFPANAACLLGVETARSWFQR